MAVASRQRSRSRGRGCRSPEPLIMPLSISQARGRTSYLATSGRRAAWAASALAVESAAEQRGQHCEPVAPRDLLALVVLAPGIGDRHLVDAVAGLQDAGSDLGVEAPAWLAQGDLAGNVSGEHLVAGLHI